MVSPPRAGDAAAGPVSSPERPPAAPPRAGAPRPPQASAALVGLVLASVDRALSHGSWEGWACWACVDPGAREAGFSPDSEVLSEVPKCLQQAVVRAAGERPAGRAGDPSFVGAAPPVFRRCDRKKNVSLGACNAFLRPGRGGDPSECDQVDPVRSGAIRCDRKKGALLGGLQRSLKGILWDCAKALVPIDPPSLLPFVRQPGRVSLTARGDRRACGSLDGSAQGAIALTLRHSRDP